MPAPVTTTVAAFTVALASTVCPATASAQAVGGAALVPSIVLAQAGTAAGTAEDEPVRNIGEWNLPSRGERLAISGYDPVAYFPEGGSKPTKGDKKITAEYEGVTYRFKTTKNRDLFLAKPDRYEPAHGGWCSYAMLEGGKTEPNPKTFIVQDDRLFLFYNAWGTNTRSLWEKGNHDSQASTSDTQWESISGESSRQVALDD